VGGPNVDVVSEVCNQTCPRPKLIMSNQIGPLLWLNVLHCPPDTLPFLIGYPPSTKDFAGDQLEQDQPSLVIGIIIIRGNPSSSPTSSLTLPHPIFTSIAILCNMRSKFKDEHTFEKRKAEAERIRQKYTDRIPVCSPYLFRF